MLLRRRFTARATILLGAAGLAVFTIGTGCGDDASTSAGGGGATSSTGGGGAATGGAASTGGSGSGASGTGGATSTGGGGTGGAGGSGTGGTGSGGSTGTGGGGGGCQTTTGGDLLSVGDADKLLLKGTIVSPTTSFVGEVLIVGSTITCVAASCSASPGAATASVVDTHGVILPGLVDAHNHVLYDVFDEDDWSPPANNTYEDHNDWTNDPVYNDVVDAKQYLNGQTYKNGIPSPIDLSCELDKYGELKGLIAGTTSMQGQHGTDRSCFQSLVHTLSTSASISRLPMADKMQVSALTLPSNAVADGVCSNYADGSTLTFAVHLGEGKIGSPSQNELDGMALLPTSPTAPNMPGCLMVPETTLIHADAFDDPQLAQIGQIGMSIVASVHVQAVLYGHGTDYTVVTDIPLARSHGINIGLGPDWSLGGSVNMLEEMRWVDLVDASLWGDVLTPKDIVEMATIGGAKAMHLDSMIGSLAVGKVADVVVIRGDTANPYDAILAATPDEVMMTIINGKVLYGDTNLQQLGPASPGCETLDVCCGSKFLCVAEPGGTVSNKLGQTFVEIRTALEDGLTNAPAPYPNFMPLAPLFTCQ